MSTSVQPLLNEDLYSVSWSNPSCSHLLCCANVLDYFCDLSNPFYDRQCNNEVVRMQRLSSEQLLCMTGIEFFLHHAQEPILFVIRKQRRLSSTQVTPLAYYYIINGTVLQAPDLSTLLNSRLLTTVSWLTKVLQTLAPSARYHSSDGSYSWDDSREDNPVVSEAPSTASRINKSTTRDSSAAPATLFQVQRTDFLLAEWANRFPSPAATMAAAAPQATSVSSTPTSAVVTSTSISAAMHIKEEPITTTSATASPVSFPTKPTAKSLSSTPGMPPASSTVFPRSKQKSMKS